MTKQQHAAIVKLTYVLTEQKPLPCNARGNIKTGVNTSMLHGLRYSGYISCSDIYLRGIVSPDIKLHVGTQAVSA
jgi:hypothetical protein